MEKIAGEMAKEFITNDATGKIIEVFKIYGIIINEYLWTLFIDTKNN